MIAVSLNDPYGYDIQDIRLNKITGGYALSTLSYYVDTEFAPKSLINDEHRTPDWLNKPVDARQRVARSRRALNSELTGFRRIKDIVVANLRRIFFSMQTFTILVGFLVWTGVVMFGMYYMYSLTPVSEQNPVCRWWCPYVPVPGSIALYISLGLFLLLGFWLNDCYGRYWSGLMMWHNNVRNSVEHLSNQLCIVVKNGHWHERDRERIFSYLAALPYAGKAVLRNSRDMSEVKDLLSPDDYESLCKAPHFVTHITTVLMAYFSSIDMKDENTMVFVNDPLGCTRFLFGNGLMSLELTLSQCESHRFIPLPPSITIHVRFLIFFWLALLPVAVVKQNGPLSFLYVIPIAYSILTLYTIGTELADPYGDDPSDIPVDEICDEIKEEIHQVFHDNIDAPESVLYDAGYKRESMKPLPKTDEDVKEQDRSSPGPSLGQSLQNLLSSLPNVLVVPQIAATLWIVIAVFLSRYLSYSWDEIKRNHCRQWCSPIDVDPGTLSNIGYALFLILGFRTSDALNRYEQGGTEYYEIEKAIHNLVTEFCSSIEDGFLHRGDKERFVALMAQVPLAIRDTLLNIKRTDSNKVGLLTDEDWEKMKEHASPFMFLIRTLEAYLFKLGMDNSGHPSAKLHRPFPMTKRLHLMIRINELRNLIVKAIGVKRFPGAMSYINHQQLFMGLWIVLLPLAMTPWTGWVTIIWGPIICYGVLSLENIALKLVDPHGTDEIDLPVERLCEKASNAAIKAAWSIGWSYEAPTEATGVIQEPYIGAQIEGTVVKQEYSLAHFENETESESTVYGTVIRFHSLAKSKARPTLYAHFLQSVPWSVLLSISVYTLICTVISYSFRYEEKDMYLEWWQSRISISASVASYLSIAGMFATRVDFVPNASSNFSDF